MRYFVLRVLLCCSAAAAYSMPVFAQSVTVDNAWVRATVPAQTTTGAFMEITSKDGAALVGVSSSAAATVEIHEMRMDGNVMTMRELDKLELPAGKTVAFAPGAYHLMLINLKRPLRPGDTVPLSLELESRNGKHSKLEVKAEVRASGGAR